jgi:hypothetical protein
VRVRSFLPGRGDRRWFQVVAALGFVAGMSLLSIGAIHKDGPASIVTSESALTDLRDRQEAPGMRQHAWIVFSELTKVSDPADKSSAPIWDTWEDRSELRSASTSGKVDHSKNRELDLPLEVLASIMTRNKDDRIAVGEAVAFIKNRGVGPEVLYNPSAANHIRTNKLNDPQSLGDRWKMLNDLDAPVSETSIVQFPESSIVVKAIWLSVGPKNPEVLRVWEPPDVSQSECEFGCMKDIKVQLAAPTDPCNLPVVGSAPVLSTCFYNVPNTKREGHRLILFGLHVATKEIPDWTWSTFWWQLDPDKKPFAAGRPSQDVLEGYWRNYVMDTTLSMVTPEELTLRATGTLPKSTLPICDIDDRQDLF